MIHINPKTIIHSMPSTGSVGVTSGCFDLLHPMHVEYLNKCRKCCDTLLVLVDSDMFIWMNKNKSPVINQLDRAYMVDSLRCVSSVGIIDSIDELQEVIQAMVKYKSQPPLKIFKNSHTIYGAPLIEVKGAQNIIIPDVERFSSTTQIIDFLKKQSEELYKPLSAGLNMHS